RLGTLPAEEVEAAWRRLEGEERVLREARSTSIPPALANPLLERAGGRGLSESARVSELVRRPGVSLVEMMRLVGWEGSTEAAVWGEVELKYDGYLEREQEAAVRLREQEGFLLPGEL